MNRADVTNQLRRAAALFLVGVVVGMAQGTRAAGPPVEPYDWSPVRLGAGGFVTGFVTHPKDAAIRYCRTDVGNAYRWDGTEWRPMVVREDGKGMPKEAALTPSATGVDAIAVAPADARVVYLAMKGERPDAFKALAKPIGSAIYRSRDGGRTFTAGPIPVEMEPNGPWRTEGERLRVDPVDGKVVYYGSVKQGLWRSVDSGSTWSRIQGNGGPDPAANVLAVHAVASSGPIATGGPKRSRVIFAVVAKGSVYRSEDGGATWKNVSAGTELDGNCKFSTLDPSGHLYVMAEKSRDAWVFARGRWSRSLVQLPYNATPHAIAFDPRKPSRVFAISDGAGLSRSLDGGKTWTEFTPELKFANTLGWLPQKPGWRSNAGISVDAEGTVWIPQGNEGMLSCKMTDRENVKNPPRWKIDSVGIEEFVTHDVILPPRGDTVFAVEDATGLVSSDLSKFVARQIPLQDQFISNGTGLAYCPNAPEYLAVVSADVNYTSSGKSYSGYSPDGGKTWKPFAGLPKDPSGKPIQPAGSIAISRRGSWGLGADHLVWLPNGEGPTYFSHDGGATWNPSRGFPLKSGYWIFALKQRLLAADPFTPDTFYFVGSWAGGFYVSTDGGQSWRLRENAGLPSFNHHAQLATNPTTRGDLWFCDGWDGANQHGLWRSKDGGASFKKVPGFDFALTICLGAGRGQRGDSPFTVYVYGKRTDSPDWGVFRSTDAGAKWARIANYPAGIFDQPTCMAASWDRFGQVVVGFNGNSFVRGEPRPAAK